MNNPGTMALDVGALRRKYEEERDKRLRNLTKEAYPNLEGDFSHFARDPYTPHVAPRSPVSEDVDTLVIGCGIAGLSLAVRLRQAGAKSIRMVDKAADFGGAWYWNRYPGAACDVESYIYLPLLDDTGYMPSERYVSGVETQQYCARLAEKYDLRDAALFQTAVSELRWNEEGRRWQVKTDRGDCINARFVVSAAGSHSNPKLPKIPGINDFEGHSFHTSRWDYEYTGGDIKGSLTGLVGKKVGIIGTGSTSIQVMPKVAEWAEHVYVFQRTPISIDPRDNRPTDPEWFNTQKPGWQRARQENFDRVLSGDHSVEDLTNDGWTDLIRYITSPTSTDSVTADPEELALAGLTKMEMARQRIEQVVDDRETAEALKPYYDYFCKRPGFSDEYLLAFNRPNVTLVDTDGEGVDRITANGVIVKNREYPLDCLIYATGFDFLLEYSKEIGLEAYGRNDTVLSEHWKVGPRTLYGVHTDKFPNLFFMRIPQAGNSFNYTTTAAEQALHIAYVISHCLEAGIASVEAAKEAVDGWVAEVIEGAEARAAFSEACTPSYYNYEGNPDRATFAKLNALYGGGALAYFDMLHAWKDEGKLRGFQIEAAPH